MILLIEALRRCRPLQSTEHHRLGKAATLAAAFKVLLVAVARGAPLSLKYGVDVAQPFLCKEAPNARMLQWDGAGFLELTAANTRHVFFPIRETDTSRARQITQ